MRKEDARDGMAAWYTSDKRTSPVPVTIVQVYPDGDTVPVTWPTGRQSWAKLDNLQPREVAKGGK